MRHSRVDDISTARYGEGPSQASSLYTRVVNSVAAFRVSDLAIVQTITKNGKCRTFYRADTLCRLSLSRGVHKVSSLCLRRESSVFRTFFAG